MPNLPVHEETILGVIKIQRRIRVIFSTGKSVEYLRGGLSFTSLLSPGGILIGENGGEIFFNEDKKRMRSTRYQEELDKLEDKLVSKGVDFYKEPKDTCLTLFSEYFTVGELEKVCQSIIEDNDLHLYTIKHYDCLDVMQEGVDKGAALKTLEDFGYLELKATAAIGDSENDIPMLEVVGLPLTVENAAPEVKKICKEVAPLKYGTGLTWLLEKVIKCKL